MAVVRDGFDLVAGGILPPATITESSWLIPLYDAQPIVFAAQPHLAAAPPAIARPPGPPRR